LRLVKEKASVLVMAFR